MIDGGITLLVLAGVSAVAWLLARVPEASDNGLPKIDPAKRDGQQKGPGDAGQALGPSDLNTPLPEGSLEGTGADGNLKAGAPALSVTVQEPVPVSPPDGSGLGAGGFVPPWTNGGGVSAPLVSPFTPPDR